MFSALLRSQARFTRGATARVPLNVVSGIPCRQAQQPRSSSRGISPSTSTPVNPWSRPILPGLRAGHSPRAMAAAAAAAAGGSVQSGPLQFEAVEVENPKELNFILGQAHFIKTVEDLYEALIQSGTALRFGIAFVEASGDRKIRFDGNDEELVSLAKQNAMKVGAGHSFFVFLDAGFPVNCLKAIQQCPTVCRIYCATANPTCVVVACQGQERRGIMGVLDGLTATDYENDSDKQKRHDFLRMIGYKR